MLNRYTKSEEGKQNHSINHKSIKIIINESTFKMRTADKILSVSYYQIIRTVSSQGSSGSNMSEMFFGVGPRRDLDTSDVLKSIL